MSWGAAFGGLGGLPIGFFSGARISRLESRLANMSVGPTWRLSVRCVYA